MDQVLPLEGNIEMASIRNTPSKVLIQWQMVTAIKHPDIYMVDSHENWTIGVSGDDNFGIFKVPNMFLHIISLYCIGVHLSRTISGHLILLFLDA